MSQPKMILMKDGYHYKECSAILVENGKIIKYFYTTYLQGVIGFTLIDPIPAWNINTTWSSLASSRMKQINTQQVEKELTSMPHKCRLRLQEHKKYG